jgi:hypothetical protein
VDWSQRFAPQSGGLGFFFEGVLCFTWGGYPDTHGTVPRAMRVEYPGAIYHVMDREDRREDVFIFAGQVDCGRGSNWHGQRG